MHSDQPAGTVTLVFTDIEGSTRLLEELGTDAYRQALADHRAVVREACSRYGGYEVDYEGDAFFYAFSSAGAAVSALSEAMASLRERPVKIRVGIHTGEPALDPPKYVGLDVHLAARIMTSAHGGQIVLSKATRDLLDGLELTDLGEHRLKDIADPVAIYQLGSEHFPPLKTISNTNLPRPASSFVGRERELADVLEKLDHGARLLTLTGPGGSGKTRLALEAAVTRVPDYKAGVFWVGLAALRDPALVTETIAQTLGSKNGLAEHIGERELLLLLDNLEQVIEAAPELSQLLRACPNLTLLCTSRELLRVSGEVEYEVLPLASPEAVSLFCERAQLEATDEIQELCARLDNLPLAVELAAARTKALIPAQILDRLSQRLDLLKGGRDADPRQQTLRATIAWSYDLLSEEERRLVRALSVFTGGCTLEAAEEVADADLDTLQSLVEKSLLRFTNGRYWMLETIREYSAERLEESDEAELLRRRHADNYLTMAESLPVDVPVASEWLDRMEAEHDNSRAALDVLDGLRETQLMLRLVGALWRLWAVRGPHAEGMRRLDQALSSDERPTAARAGVLTGAAALAVDVKEYEQARRYADEALDLYRGLENGWGIARATFFQGYVAIESADFAGARPFLEESLERFTELDADHDVQLVLFNLSWACEELGERERAQDLADELLRRARASGRARNIAFALDLVWFYAREESRFNEALEAAVESLRIRREEGDVQHELDGLSRFAAIHARTGKLEAAAQLLSSSLHLHEEHGMQVPKYQEERNEGTLALIRAELDEQRLALAWGDGQAMSLDEAVELALGSAFD